MADYRALAQALDPYAMDTGGITPDTIKALQSGYKSPNLLGMIGDIGRGGLSNLESLVRGGVAQFGGTPVDTLNTIRTPYPMEVMGDVNYAPDKQVYGGTKDILGMMPKRVTQARPETAGMEELGTVMGPGLAKAAMPAVRAGQKGLNLLGMEVADRVATGQSVLPSLLKEPQSAMFAVNPADQMAQAITKAEVSPLGFYSAVEQQALKIPRKQGTGDSFLNDLMKGQDVKKYEIEAMGLEDYLRGKPNVTRQEVQDFIANNRLNVQQTQLGGKIEEDPLGIAKREEIFNKYEPEIQDLYRRLDKPEYVMYDKATNEVLRNYDTYEDALVDNLKPDTPSGTYIRPKENSRELQQQLESLQNKRDVEANAAYTVPQTKPTKYDKYQLPGGENYRELLLTLPNKPMDAGMAAENYYTQFVKRGGEPEWAQLNPAKQQEITNAMPTQARNASVAPEYRSSHFNEPNILAHMRVNDRVDAEGKKMLLIEEVQSDWHQAGREQGYQKPNLKPEDIEIKYISSTIPEGQNPANYPGYYEAFNKNTGEMIGRHGGTLSEEQVKRDALYVANNMKTGVPDAPFKDTWHQLALKRAIKEAVDKGYDRIGLTTGAQQAERYKLTNEVDEINVIGRIDARTGEKSRQVALDLKSGGSYKLGVNNEGIIDNVNMLEINNLQGKKLADVVGKEVAKKIMESNSQTIKGEGLNIGGEGMKKYYDEVYPNYLNKLGKKYGSQVGETNVKTQTGEPAFVDYIVGPGNFNNTTVLGLRSDGTTAIINQNANSMEEAQQLANRYKEKHLGGGQEKVRYLDITPEMRKAVKEGQPLASIEEELAKALA